MNDNFAARLRELPENLSNHLMLTVIALCVGVLVSVPLAIWLVKRKGLRYPILTGAGVLQTIPSLALLALMVPLLDRTNGFGLNYLGFDVKAFGFAPAAIALTAYSILPILRNTVTGILGVDPAMTEAARGVGMTPRQTLWKVELPLAAPVIIAGVRTSTVWVVGIATLATPVGQRCLGNYIFAGLQTRNWLMVMFGVVSAAALAILLDLLIGGLQKAAEERRARLGAISGGAVLLIIAGGLISPAIVDALAARRAAPVDTQGADSLGAGEDAARTEVIRIGAKTFSEQYILASLIEHILTGAGHRTRRTESLGSIIVYQALANEDLDIYVDYSGTIWANTMNRSDSPPGWRVLAEMTGWLAQEEGIRALGPLGFENAYALVMTRRRADELGVDSISDLVEHAPDMTIGGDYEFFSRPEWDGLRSAYGLRFASTTSYDSSLMYQAVAQGQVDVIAAFSTDGRIEAFDLVTLDDPRGAIPPYDAVLLLGPTIADRADIANALRPLINAIDAPMMRRANYMVDRNSDKKTAEEAAQWLLEQVRGAAANQ